MPTFKQIQSSCLILAMVCLSPGSLSADTLLAGNISEYHSSRVDGHAPISVMGDHLHREGEWMLSYRYSAMFMQGSQIGRHNVTNQAVLDNFTVVPTEMSMQMHMFGFMYAPSDKLTLMMMVPFIRKDMNHRNRMGVTFRTNSEGFGDTSLKGLVPLFSQGAHQVHLTAGLSLPTGNINEQDTTPLGTGKRLPYPMQLGTGTFDLLPGITYRGGDGPWSWGTQGNVRMNLGRNKIGYGVGNTYEILAWGSRVWSEHFSQSIGARYRIWENYSGGDPGLNPQFVPTAETNSRGGKRIDLMLGFNSILPGDNRLAFEAALPVFQSLDGPQLETDWGFTLGIQRSFG